LVSRKLWLLAGIAAVLVAHLWVYFTFLTPYYPVPSDDFSLRASVEGKIGKGHINLIVLISLFRAANALGTALPEGLFASTYDAMLLVSHLLHFATGLVLALVVRRYTRSMLWPFLALIGFLAASWTNVYTLLISHASAGAFFFSLAVAIILRLRDLTFPGAPEPPGRPSAEGGRTEAIFLLLGLSVTTVCLLLSTSAGPFWAASLCLLLASSFAFSLTALLRLRGWEAAIALLREKWTARNLVVLTVTQIPFILLGLYMIRFRERILQPFQDNLDAGHLSELQEGLGIANTNISFLSLRVLLFHLPGLSAALVALAVVWLFWQRPWRSVSSNSWCILAALLLTLVLSLVASDVHGFTKLGRSLFPFFPLILLTALLLTADLTARAINRLRIAAVILALAVAFFAFHAARSIDNYRVRYDFLRFLMAQAADVPAYLLAADPHARWIENAAPRPFRYLTTLSGLPASVQRGGILVVGPGGKDSGRSFLHRGLLSDFVRPDELTTLLKSAHARQFPYYAYLPAFLQEEENTQLLFFRGLMPDPEDPEKQAVVWTSPR
jgi:hypothetical protein